jgi:hypothetical protein
MGLWNQLSLEQYAVMIVAFEENYLQNVLDEYGMRLRWAQTGDTSLSSELDANDKAALIPRFASVVDDLVRRGWLEIYEPRAVDDNGSAGQMGEDRRREVLSDHANWLPRDDDLGTMIELGTTDAWDDLLRRAAPPHPSRNDG